MITVNNNQQKKNSDGKIMAVYLVFAWNATGKLGIDLAVIESSNHPTRQS